MIVLQMHADDIDDINYYRINNLYVCQGLSPLALKSHTNTHSHTALENVNYFFKKKIVQRHGKEKRSYFFQFVICAVYVIVKLLQ